MKKYLQIISLIMIFCMVTLYGCSSSGNMSMKSSDYSYNYAAERMEEAEYGGYYDSYDYDALAPATAAAWDGGYNNEVLYEMETLSAQLPAGRKIIRDANLSIQADSVEEAYAGILASMNFLGGYEFKRDMSGEGKSAYLRATVKIPAAKLDEFLSSAKGVGKVLNSHITSSDITDEYYDSETRLKTLEKTLEKYYEFLENATKIDDQLRISNQISDITYQIESLKGRMRKWDSLVEYSTVDLYISATPEPYVEEREIKWNSLSFEDVKYLATSGLVGITSAIVSMFQWILIIFIALSPIVIPLVIIIIVILKVTKKRRNKKLIEKNKENENVDNNIQT